MSFQSSKMPPPGESRKRKEREALPSFYSASSRPSIPLTRPHHQLHYPAQPKPPPPPSNGLLAGYLAYEFLTRGTILGEKFGPATTEAVPVKGAGESAAAAEGKKEESERKYAEVASLLKTEGAHIPGIVNPTQLARWIRM